MDLSLSDEQRQLHDSALRYIAQRYDAARRRQILASPGGFSAEVWADFAAFGWLALPLPEADGGLGGDAVDVGLLMQAFGRGLVMEPYVSTVLLAGGLIASCGDAAQRAAWLPAIAAGKTLLALAHAEDPRHRFDQVHTRAVRTASGWSISGRKRVIVDGPLANALIVSARIDTPDAPLALFVVERSSRGLREQALATIDGRRACDIEFIDTPLPPDARLGDGDATPALDAALDTARAALAAEALGCMRALLEATLEHVRTRRQFGQPLSANQVLRHRLVDMAVLCEEAESMALLAAMKAAAPAEQRALVIAAALDKTVRAARFVAEQAVQLHGAMGVTEEASVGAWLKRLLAIEAGLGTPGYHLQRFARLRQAQGPRALNDLTPG